MLPLSGFFFKFRYTLMQISVLPLQRLDFVTPEKRTDTFGNVGRSCCGCTFQLLGLYLFLSLTEFFPCRFFMFLQSFIG